MSNRHLNWKIRLGRTCFVVISRTWFVTTRFIWRNKILKFCCFLKGCWAYGSWSATHVVIYWEVHHENLSLSFSFNIFRFCLYPIHPSFNIHFDREMKGSHLPVLKKTRKSEEEIFEPWLKVDEIWDVGLQATLLVFQAWVKMRGGTGRLQNIECEKNEKHSSRLHILAQLTAPTISLFTTLAAFSLAQKSNALVFPYYYVRRHCPPKYCCPQMTLLMTPNDLITTLLHRWGTTSLVKHFFAGKSNV